MKTLFVILVILFLFAGCKNESTNISPVNGEEPATAEFLKKAEEMPEPVGGIAAIQSKLLYPEIAKRAGIEGRVFILAFIDEYGNVVNTKVVKGVDSGGLNEAAEDAVRNTKFTPAKNQGIPVKVQVTVPIEFKLEK
jgi:periplasmic protein TonB